MSDEGAAGSPDVQRRVLHSELWQQRRPLEQPQSLAGWRQQRPETRLHHSRGPGHQHSHYAGNNSTVNLRTEFLS